MGKHTEASKQAEKKQAHSLPLGGIAAVVLVVVLAIAYVICCTVVDQETVLGHTVVNGVDLKGMTRQEAAAALEAEYEADYAEVSISVEANGDVYEVPVAEALTLDTDQGVELAFRRGHGAFLTRGAALLQSLGWTRTYEQLPQVTDLDALQKAVEDAGLMDIDTTVQTTYEVTEGTLIFTKGVTGTAVDGGTLLSLLEEAVNQGDYDSVVECPMQTGTVEPVDLQALYNELYIAPENATLDPEADYAIVESVTGVSFDIMNAQTLLDTSAEGSTVEVPLEYTEPDITTALMEENLFRDVLGSYTTTVKGTSNRKSNVKLSAQKCNEVILLPGETFSYNDTVGQRTTEAGFKTAAAYLNGETVQEVGGGICQVSSTLYNAVLLSNLEITQRQNHTYAVSYVPLGQDATVSWGGPDFQFTNNTTYPIKIATSYSSSDKLTCQIYGTNLTGNTVKIISETLSTTPYKVEKEETDSLYVGDTSVKVEGETGYKVQTYREVYDANGELISSQEEAYSVYSKRDEMLLVGTKEKPTQKETTQSSGNKNSSSSGSNSGSGSSGSGSNSGSSNSGSGNSGSGSNSSSSNSGSNSDSNSSGSSGSSDNSSNSSSGNSDATEPPAKEEGASSTQGSGNTNAATEEASAPEADAGTEG